MSSWAILKPESDLWEIFPSGMVQIISIVPMIPREEGAPSCYLIKSSELNPEQLGLLAHRMYQKWQPECANYSQALDYVREDFPLRTAHFSGCSTDDFYQVPWGAALNIAMRDKNEK